MDRAANFGASLSETSKGQAAQKAAGELSDAQKVLEQINNKIEFVLASRGPAADSLDSAIRAEEEIQEQQRKAMMQATNKELKLQLDLKQANTDAQASTGRVKQAKAQLDALLDLMEQAKSEFKSSDAATQIAIQNIGNGVINDRAALTRKSADILKVANFIDLQRAFYKLPQDVQLALMKRDDIHTAEQLARAVREIPLVLDGRRRSAMCSPKALLQQRINDHEVAGERARASIDSRRSNSAEFHMALVKLSAEDEKLVRTAIEDGRLANAAQIPGILPKLRAEAELNSALAKLSVAHQKLVRAAIEAGQIDVYQAIASVNKLALAEAFESLPKEVQKKLLAQYASGEIADAAQLKVQAVLAQTQLIDQDRRAALALPQMAFAAEQNAARLERGMRDRLAGDSAFMQNGGTQSDIASGHKNVWAQASGDQSNAAGSAGAAGFSMRGAGVNVGADTTFDNSRVGIALGYANSTIDARGKHAKSKVDTFSVGLYGSHSINNWFANAGVSYSGHSIKSDRNAVVGGTSYGMSAKTHGDTVGGFVEFGKKIEMSLVNITPSVIARINNTSIKGFAESGVASVTADKSEYLSARVGFGVHLWKDFGDENHRITPSLRITYEREIADSAPSMDVVLHGINGLAPMHTNLSGLKLGRDIISAQAGVTMQLSKRLSANAAINTSWRQHETQIGASGSIIYHW